MSIILRALGDLQPYDLLPWHLYTLAQNVRKRMATYLHIAYQLTGKQTSFPLHHNSPDQVYGHTHQAHQQVWHWRNIYAKHYHLIPWECLWESNHCRDNVSFFVPFMLFCTNCICELLTTNDECSCSDLVSGIQQYLWWIIHFTSALWCQYVQVAWIWLQDWIVLLIHHAIFMSGNF